MATKKAPKKVARRRNPAATKVCIKGHDMPASAKRCPECGQPAADLLYAFDIIGDFRDKLKKLEEQLEAERKTRQTADQKLEERVTAGEKAMGELKEQLKPIAEALKTKEQKDDVSAGTRLANWLKTH